MKMKNQLARISILLLCIFANVCCKERLKLSSLPQLKRWEIPMMPQKYAMRTGRKFKDIDHIFESGKKRSSHWSIKPELQFRELDLEDDDEKIKLDHNFKVFVEDEDPPIITAKKNNIDLKIKKTKASQKKTNNDNADKISENRLKTNSKYLNDVAMKSKKMGLSENNPSIKSETEQGTFLDSSVGQGKNLFSLADLKSNIQHESQPIAYQMKAKDLILQQHAMIKSSGIKAAVNNRVPIKKRAAPQLNEAARNARAVMNLSQQTKRPGTTKAINRPDLMKMVTLNNGDKSLHADFVNANKHKQLQQRSLQESKNQALKLLRSSNLGAKTVAENKGSLGDQQSNSSDMKMHTNIQSKVNANAMNSHLRNPSASPVAKPHFNQPEVAASLSQRAKIETPQNNNKSKDKMKIVPANVARAVAMAMEQLKRDKMWGKVFVHVLPSGKLKVMVQETKKMPDE